MSLAELQAAIAAAQQKAANATGNAANAAAAVSHAVNAALGGSTALSLAQQLSASIADTISKIQSASSSASIAQPTSTGSAWSNLYNAIVKAEAAVGQLQSAKNDADSLAAKIATAIGQCEDTNSYAGAAQSALEADVSSANDEAASIQGAIDNGPGPDGEYPLLQEFGN